MKRFATILAIALFGIATQYTYAQENAVETVVCETMVAYPEPDVEIVTEEVCCAETMTAEPIHAARPSFIQRYGFWTLVLVVIVLPSLIIAVIIAGVVVLIAKRRNSKDELELLQEENARLQREKEIARLRDENERLRNSMR